MSLKMDYEKPYLCRKFIFGLLLIATPTSAGNITIDSFTVYPANVTTLRENLATFLLQKSSVSCATMCLNLSGCAGFLYDEQTWTCQLGRGLVNSSNPISGSSLYQKVYYMFGLPAIIACNSLNSAAAQCQLPAFRVNMTSVALFSQISNATCTKNVSFWLDATSSLWVTKGCRGKFSIDA